ALGYTFKDRGKLHQALVHRSYAHERDLDHDNEPLEFLGDAVLGFLVAERIVRRRPDMGEGNMTRLRSSLVNTQNLAEEAGRLGLGSALLLGKGEEGTGGRSKPALLANGFEAVIGALFLDGGIRPVRTLVRRLFTKRIEQWPTDHASRMDAKTRLQEFCQARGWPLPVYQVVRESGPDHQRRFTIEVLVQGRSRGRGSGTAKRRAEQAAAADALERLGRSRAEASTPARRRH
ncbi:MAG: ribonuclease III, partial [Acidobacteriota bacterium]|nr:ribonuclease III [Acidobacteriota bacterium]